MPLDRDQMREYQRQRRAKQKEAEPVELDRHGFPWLKEEPPSWEELIPRMPDKLIDKILNNPAIYDPRRHPKRDAP